MALLASAPPPSIAPASMDGGSLPSALEQPFWRAISAPTSRSLARPRGSGPGEGAHERASERLPPPLVPPSRPSRGWHRVMPLQWMRAKAPLARRRALLRRALSFVRTKWRSPARLPAYPPPLCLSKRANFNEHRRPRAPTSKVGSRLEKMKARWRRFGGSSAALVSTSGRRRRPSRSRLMKNDCSLRH